MSALDMDKVYQRVTDLLALREGNKTASYRDTRGYLTGGIGHRLTAEEIQAYPENTEIPPHVRARWWAEDRQWAIDAAMQQAREVQRESDIDLVVGLASVNFQLGPKWNQEHVNTWRLMKEGKWGDAAVEAANSKWRRQTPKRVADFQEALRKQQIMTAGK